MPENRKIKWHEIQKHGCKLNNDVDNDDNDDDNGDDDDIDDDGDDVDDDDENLQRRSWSWWLDRSPSPRQSRQKLKMVFNETI